MTSPLAGGTPEAVIHQIGLRRAWQRFPGIEPLANAQPIDLPAQLDPQWGICTLTRSFQTPQVNPELEYVVIVVDDTPGLIEARLDANPLNAQQPPLARRHAEVPLNVRRHLIQLVADTGAAGTGPWGRVWLEIRRRDRATQPARSSGA